MREFFIMIFWYFFSPLPSINIDRSTKNVSKSKCDGNRKNKWLVRKSLLFSSPPKSQGGATLANIVKVKKGNFSQHQTWIENVKSLSTGFVGRVSLKSWQNFPFPPKLDRKEKCAISLKNYKKDAHNHKIDLESSYWREMWEKYIRVEGIGFWGWIASKGTSDK